MLTHSAAAAAESFQSTDSVRPHRRQPTRLPRPWDSPGRNTGVGCHFLLQCMKGKSESEVTQSCPTPSDPMDCSPPGSSVHGVFQARVLEWGAIAFSVTHSRYPLYWHWRFPAFEKPPGARTTWVLRVVGEGRCSRLLALLNPHLSDREMTAWAPGAAFWGFLGEPLSPGPGLCPSSACCGAPGGRS